MRIIVPLQGVVQGRGSVVLGSLIPCALFYFLQLYIRQRRPPPPPPDEPQDDTPAASPSPQTINPPKALSRPTFFSARAGAVIDNEDSPYYTGWREYLRNPYDDEQNPEGVIQLGLAENKLSFDLVESWLSSYPETSMWGEGRHLSLKDIAGYQDSQGLPTLRLAMSSFMEEVMGGEATFNADRIVLTAGATAALEVLAFCLADDGDAFLVPSPYYPGFDRDMKWRSRVELVPVQCYSCEDFVVTRMALERAYNQTQRRGTTVRAVLITSPGNPLGHILGPDSLRSLLSFVREKNIHLICDEIYAGSVYEGNFLSIAEILASGDFDTSRVHIIYGLSKDLGIPGFRVGVLYTYNDKVLSAAQRFGRFCGVSSHTQGLLVSLLSDKGFVRSFLEENKIRLRNRHKAMVTGLHHAGIHCFKSRGGLYCWVDMRHFLPSENEEGERNLWKRLLYEIRINVTPGLACHCNEPGWFRVCFATVSDQALTVTLNRLQRFTEKNTR